MRNEDSLGPMGPNVISVESVSDTVFSVEGHNFESGFRVRVEDGVARQIEGVTVSDLSAARFRITLPYATPGTCTLVVTNPDGRTSTKQFQTPGTTASNERLRADS